MMHLSHLLQTLYPSQTLGVEDLITVKLKYHLDFKGLFTLGYLIGGILRACVAFFCLNFWSEASAYLGVAFFMVLLLVIC